ncbi:MAG: hypothetical protein ACOYOT_02380 [Bacteroidales bacterium]
MKKFNVLIVALISFSALQAKSIYVSNSGNDANAGTINSPVLSIFMADRWNPNIQIDARYSWQPILFEHGIPVLKWQDNWNI